MADFLAPNEGKTELASNGLPATCTFNLSTKTVDEVGVSATYGGGFGIATGTGYAAKTEAEPTPTNGVVQFAVKEWKTESATDWPAAVKSCWLSNGTSKLICGWNLQAGGGGRAMNAANTTEKFTPKLEVT
jgi:hypothetical protein